MGYLFILNGWGYFFFDINLVRGLRYWDLMWCLCRCYVLREGWCGLWLLYGLWGGGGWGDGDGGGGRGDGDGRRWRKGFLVWLMIMCIKKGFVWFCRFMVMVMVMIMFKL